MRGQSIGINYRSNYAKLCNYVWKNMKGGSTILTWENRIAENDKASLELILKRLEEKYDKPYHNSFLEFGESGIMDDTAFQREQFNKYGYLSEI